MKKHETATHDLARLIAEAEVLLERQKHTAKHICQTRGIWNDYTAYAEARGEAQLTYELVRDFLRDQHGCKEEDAPHPLPAGLAFALRAMEILMKYALHGHWRRGPSWSRQSLSVQHEKILEEFSADWFRRGLSERALRPCLVRLRQFLLFLEARELCYTQVTPKVLSDFVSAQYDFREKTVELIAYYLRSFLRFLHLHGHLPSDLAADVPSARAIKCRQIPSVWHQEDVERLLSVVDRGNPGGKRDYAILLLVTKLGLRVGDIRELRLEHFQWEAKQIVFSQSKTGEVISLPLLDEIGWAVIDYLQNGRPKTSARHLFITHTPPYEPFGPNNNLYAMIDLHRQKAGILLPAEQRRGLHSLRHTLATALLGQETPLSTIGAILGHRDSGSTTVYLKVDLAQLRQCALDPEELANVSK